MDNECPKELKCFLKDRNIDMQHTPPHNHRPNAVVDPYTLQRITSWQDWPACTVTFQHISGTEPSHRQSSHSTSSEAPESIANYPPGSNYTDATTSITLEYHHQEPKSLHTSNLTRTSLHAQLRIPHHPAQRTFGILHQTQ